MSFWSHRAAEERTLLNPSFCGVLLWQSASGYSSTGSAVMPFELVFLVLPLVLHKETRETLPRSITTSLAMWLNDSPLVRTRVGERTRTLTPFTKEALMFGGMHGLVGLSGAGVRANLDWKRRVLTVLKAASDEVRECAKRAEFVGKWFERAGSSRTVMALLGVKP